MAIALLEALSYNISVLVSDIPANKEPGISINDSRDFLCENLQDLRKNELFFTKNQQSNGKNH